MTLRAVFTIIVDSCDFAEIKETFIERIDMRVYRVILVVAMLVFAGNAMGMGKSDGTKKDVKSSISKETAVPAKVKAKACGPNCTKPCCAKDAKKDHKHEHPADAKKGCCGTCGGSKAVAKPGADELFVTVNGIKITQSVIDKKIQPQIDAQVKRMAAMGRPADEAMLKGMKEQMTQRTLDMMIIEQLMNEKRQLHKIKVSDAEVALGHSEDL